MSCRPTVSYLGDGSVADHFPHDGFVHITEGFLDIADAEQVLVRVRNAVLHDPLDHRDVEVTGEHERLVLELSAGEVRAHTRIDGAETELFLELALHLHRRDDVDEGDLHAQAGVGDRDELAEALNDADFLGLYLVEGRPGDHQDGNDQDDGADQVLGDLRAAGSCWCLARIDFRSCDHHPCWLRGGWNVASRRRRATPAARSPSSRGCGTAPRALLSSIPTLCRRCEARVPHPAAGIVSPARGRTRPARDVG